MPVLSIITVAAFDTQRLKKTLDSLSGILSELVEHLVIHPSRDTETMALLESREYKNKNRRSYVDLGIGIYQAMNIGVEQAAGKYVWFINSGDELVDSHLPILLSFLVENEPTWLIGKGLFDWREDQEMQIENLSSFLAFKDNAFLSHQTIIARTNILRDLGGFDVRYKVAADTDLIARICELESPMWFKEYIVKVEEPEYASTHNRRGRFESLLLSVRSRNRKSLLNILHREFLNLTRRIIK